MTRVAPFKEAEDDDVDPNAEEGDYGQDEGAYGLAQEQQAQHMQYGVDANGNGAYYGGLKGGTITLRLRGGQVSLKLRLSYEVQALTLDVIRRYLKTRMRNLTRKKATKTTSSRSRPMASSMRVRWQSTTSSPSSVMMMLRTLVRLPASRLETPEELC